MSNTSLGTRGTRDAGTINTPNCVTCSRGVAHSVCAVWHLLDRGWVIEHGPREGSAETSPRSAN